jgi:nitrous oxide reductase accessory protein NosL
MLWHVDFYKVTMMFKKIAPYLLVVVLIGFIVTLFLSLASSQKMIVIVEGNTKRTPLPMELGKHQDSDCGMVIEDLEYASQVVSKEGKTWFFHDHGGFVNWLKDKKFQEEVVIWVMSRDTHEWIDAKKAYYSVNETTPMGYGFGAYEDFEEGMIDFKEMRLRILRGETLNNPLIRKQILGGNDGNG